MSQKTHFFSVWPPVGDDCPGAVAAVVGTSQKSALMDPARHLSATRGPAAIGAFEPFRSRPPVGSPVPQSPPTISPDGRFRWDGERWLPTAYQQGRTCLLVLAILGGIAAVFLAVFLIVLGPAIIELFQVFD